MKRSILVLVSLALLVFAGNASAQCTPPPDGVVGWWPGDGNASDISGAGNDGTLQGDATFAVGKVAQAFSFDGAGDLVSVTDDASLDFSSAVTIDAWINLSAFSPTVFAPVVSKWNDLGVNQRAFFLAILPDGSVRFDVSTNGKFAGGGYHTGPNTFTSTTNAVVISSPIVSLNTPTHVAAVFDGTTATLGVYVNGVLNNSVVAGFSTIFQNNEPLLIGAGDLGGNARDYFNGLVDEVEIFSSALSEPRIGAIYEAGTEGKCKLNVDIDIKPGSDPNSMNLGSAGVIPVAVLGSDTFHVTCVDVSTLDLAEATVKVVGRDRPLCHFQDANGDGFTDLVCQFYTYQFVVETGAGTAILRAKCGDLWIWGEDSIRIVP